MTMTTLFSIFLIIIPIILLLRRRRRRDSKVLLPPGSLGIPIIGQSLFLLWAMRANTADKWLEKRIKKYGPIFKISLFGKPTIFIYGQAANKLVFKSDTNVFGNHQTESVRNILGDRNISELSGSDHKRIREALMLFLKPESLKKYVGKIDSEVKKHIQLHWQGKQQVTVLPLMRHLTFDIICSLLVGLEQGPRRERFLECFQEMIAGIWSIPIDMPFSRYRRALKASLKVQDMIKELIHDKTLKLQQNGASSLQELITCLLSIQNKDNNAAVITEKEIVHNVMLVMVAGYDTSSVLITFIIRFLAKELAVYEAVLKEQEEIARTKASGEFLTWEDLAKMKYTWRVAMETLRMVPPVYGGFRKAMKDVEYGGYLIPKGWQVFWVTTMTHMDNSIFPEPSKFDPSRFENQASTPPYCFIPFGGGPRMCPGYELARIETLVAIHYLVTQFTWKLCADDSYKRDPTPIPVQGLPVQIMPKKPMEKSAFSIS